LCANVKTGFSRKCGVFTWRDCELRQTGTSSQVCMRVVSGRSCNHTRRSSQLWGPRHFAQKYVYEKINKMPKFYTIKARKIKNSGILLDICPPKIIFPEFFGSKCALPFTPSFTTMAVIVHCYLKSVADRPKLLPVFVNSRFSDTYL